MTDNCEIRLNFADLFNTLPALERELVRLRSYQLTLVLYYKDEIERCIRSSTNVKQRFVHHSAAKRADLKTAVRQMIADGAISDDEGVLIIEVVNFRNDIAHRVDHLFNDVQQGFSLKSWLTEEEMSGFGYKFFDHNIVDKCQNILRIIGRANHTHYPFGEVTMRGPLLFSSAEKSLLADIEASKKKITRLISARRGLIDSLNTEIKAASRQLAILRKDRFFDIRYPNGKMTQRGQEFCYLLFDQGYSDLAVASIFQMRLPSIRKRKRNWQRLGGCTRTHPNWDDLPAIITPSPFDDD